MGSSVDQGAQRSRSLPGTNWPTVRPSQSRAAEVYFCPDEAGYGRSNVWRSHHGLRVGQSLQGSLLE
eukprot:3250728-Pyramimonas_sp.AAC.1